MNQNYQNYQDQKYLREDELEEDDEDEEEEPTHFNPCFAANNFLGLLLAVFQMMIVIVPYWVDTNSGSSSVLLSDVRIFKGFFVSCLTRHTSQWQCHYQSFDGDFEFYSMRGLQFCAILSCSLSWIAWILSFYGSECLKILPNQTMAKVKSGLVLGAGFFEAFSVGFWCAMLSILSSIVKSEFKAELEFDAGKLQRVDEIRNQLTDTDHNYSHNIHRRSGGGGGSMQISNDDFKFQPGICYYMAIPTTILMAVFMVVLFVEGGTRLSSAISDDDVNRQSSNTSDVLLLKKETSNRQKSFSKSYGGSQQITYRKSNSVQQWRQESSEAQDFSKPIEPPGDDNDSWI